MIPSGKLRLKKHRKTSPSRTFSAGYQVILAPSWTRCGSCRIQTGHRRSLADAADGEQLLLRRLLASDGSLAETILVLPKNPAIDGDSSENGLALSAPAVFHVFDAHITWVNKLRRYLMNELDDARESLSDSGLANVNSLLFQTRYLVWDWDDFHDSFDEWRRTNGGCDQGQAL